MKPIRLTRHALQKLALVQLQGFRLDEETVINVIRTGSDPIPGYSGRLIAQEVLDTEHILRVVYEENGEIAVVTMYPGRRQRYES